MTARPRRRRATAIVEYPEGILVTVMRYMACGLPGGSIQPGEVEELVLVRELREETGLIGVFPEGLGVEGTPPGLIGYEEHLAGSKGLHMNFAFVADVPTRALTACDEYDEVLWVGRTTPYDQLACPRNVKQLITLALNAPTTAIAAG